jgi:hypothetical protein
MITAADETLLRRAIAIAALATEQLTALNPDSGWPDVPQDGPALFDEARIPIEAFYLR